MDRSDLFFLAKYYSIEDIIDKDDEEVDINLVYKQTLEVLIAARDTIKDPRNWCKYYGAKNDRGDACHPKSPDAIKFCMSGAVTNVVNKLNPMFESTRMTIHTLRDVVPCIEDFNDDDKTLHEDVINVFDIVIEKMKTKTGE